MTKKDMLRLLKRVAEDAGVKMAIGGGVAVFVHGVRRETQDVDAFFHREDKIAVLRTLRALVPPDTLIESFAGSHYVVIPPDAEPGERIDLLFALGDPEESAIETAELRKYLGVEIPVFPVEYLILSKLYALDREEARDYLDIYGLYAAGAYDIVKVEALQRLMDPDAPGDQLRDVIARVQDLLSKHKTRPRPPSRRKR